MGSSAHSVEDLRHDLEETNGVINISGEGEPRTDDHHRLGRGRAKEPLASAAIVLNRRAA